MGVADPVLLRRRSPRLLVTLALSLLAGCAGGPGGYRPATPVAIDAPAARLELEQLDGDSVCVGMPDGYQCSAGVTVGVRWRGDGAGITRAFLVPPAAAPCTVGLEAELFQVDGQVRWERPLDLGREHAITFAFPAEPALTGGPLALDVKVARGEAKTCVRLALTGAGQRLVPRSNLALGASVGLSHAVRSHSSVVLAFGAEAGRWLGPARLTLGLGLGFGSDHLMVSGGSSDDDSAKPSFVMFTLTPQLMVFPLVRGGYALGLSAGVELAAGVSATGASDDLETDESYWAPRLGVLLARRRVEPLGAPLHRFDGNGLELFAQRASSWPRDAGLGAAYVLGIGWRVW